MLAAARTILGALLLTWLVLGVIPAVVQGFMDRTHQLDAGR